jgi:hypothetical protein
MKTKYIFPSLLLVLSACTSKLTPVTPVSSEQINREEQRVYTAVLARQYGASMYVIMDTTATSLSGTDNTSSTLDHVLENMHGVAADTVTNFRNRNDTIHELSPDMQIGSAYVLISQSVKSRFFSQNQDGWQLFYEQYPNSPGITTISRVGFSGNFDQALVYAGTQSQWLAGAGFYFLLLKVNGTWIVDQQVMTWIS